MSRAKRVFSPEFREDAVRLVIDSSRPIASGARELGIGEGTLGNWVNVYRREHVGEEPGLNVSDQARLRELERKYREVKLENEFLKKAALGSRGRCNTAGELDLPRGFRTGFLSRFYAATWVFSQPLWTSCGVL